MLLNPYSLALINLKVIIQNATKTTEVNPLFYKNYDILADNVH